MTNETENKNKQQTNKGGFSEWWDEKPKMEKYLIAASTVIIIILLAALSMIHWALVDQPFFGGFFNQTFWGVQIYLFFVPLIVIFYFGAYVFWVHMKWNMMSPFHGLWVAMQSNSDVNFVTDLQLNFKLQSEGGAKLIFDGERYNSIAVDRTKVLNRIRMKLMPVDQAVSIAKYLQGSWDSKPMTNIGMIPASIILDANGWGKIVSPQRTAIAEEVDKWNDMNMDDQIHNFTKAWKYMDEGKLRKPDNVNLYVTIPWSRLDNAYPPKRYGAAWGGFVRQLAENIARGDYDKPPVSMTMAGVIVFVMCIVVSIMMFVMKIMTHVPGTK